MRIHNGIAAAALAAVVAFAGSAAFADTFYNTLDSTVDVALETMNINTVGGTGSTNIALQVDGHATDPGDPTYIDRGGCNIQGKPHYVTIAATSSDPAVATVALTPDGRFDLCSERAKATVTGISVGSSTITFDVVDSKTDNDPHNNFRTEQAAFIVNVSDGGGSNTGCDANPAAPAWANAILQKSGVKSKDATNYVSTIGREMGKGATFAGLVKNADQDGYANAVRDRLIVLTGKSMATVASSARPGWTCTSL